MREPDITCPLIDEALGDLASACTTLEAIRKANEALRQWGHHWKSEYALAAAKVRALELRVAELETQLENLENRL